MKRIYPYTMMALSKRHATRAWGLANAVPLKTDVVSDWQHERDGHK